MEVIKSGADDEINKVDIIVKSLEIQKPVETGDLCKLNSLLCTLWNQHNKPDALKMLAVAQVEKQLLHEFEVMYTHFVVPNVPNPGNDLPFTAFSWFMGDIQTRYELGNKWIRKMEQCSRDALHTIKTNQDLKDLKELLSKIPRAYMDGNSTDVKPMLRNVQKNAGLLSSLQYQLRANELKFHQLEMNVSEMEIFVSPTTNQRATNEIDYDIVDDDKWEDRLKNEIESFKKKLQRKNSVRETIMKKYNEECKEILEEIEQKTRKLNKYVNRYERKNKDLRMNITKMKKLLSNGKNVLKEIQCKDAGKLLENADLKEINLLQNKEIKEFQEQLLSKL